ncbi:hypothetical protein [Pelomicrobium methylotrophicum]|uniref:Uncharacterized protein n=1 Tax=Pelomicrobium methylotrophicum TaxID=2602750 RepID=A0A5C7EIG9_9PROT|nr:hypothetical protein [Pelomicrobium methylotrophicum]TXF11173.1 hypothetical protein FR698_11705 [Pelomicrobium methylotrophicum]
MSVRNMQGARKLLAQIERRGYTLEPDLMDGALAIRIYLNQGQKAVDQQTREQIKANKWWLLLALWERPLLHRT